MATAGWLPQQRPESFRRPGYVEEEESLFARIIEVFRPDEGFVGLGLVLLLAGIMGWSIADARWILGRDELTSFLIWVAFGGVIWGWASSRIEMSPWLAHVLGAIVAAFVIIELVGMRMPNATPGLAGWAQAAAYSATQAYLDLTWRHQVSTFQYGHFCLILGVLVWGTAQAAAYDIFSYRRSVNGVLLLAVVFVANMALTVRDQFPALVLFSAAALVLLILSHAADERSNWIAHRIWRGHDFRAPNVQGGLAFASAALAGALVLTTVASSAPLASVVSQFDLQNTLSWLNGYLPAGGQSRYQATARFGPTFAISPTFFANNDNEFTVRVSAGNVAFHWRVISYDLFQKTGWGLSDTKTDDVIAGSALDQGTADQVGSNTPGRQQMTITFHIQDPTINYLITANEPDSVNVATKRTVVGTADTSLDASSWSTSAMDYVVSAYVPNLDPAGAGLTEWQLEHAGVVYPPGLLERYTQGTDQIGQQGRSLAEEIRAWATSQGNSFDNAYDVAKAVQNYLRSPDRFKYQVNISDQMPRCVGMSTVDCFALIREGFCQQYATTMTMLMRLEGYPARFVQGYLPGKVAENTFIEQVTTQQLHAWVEVYFPNYGWIPFDPTGGPGEPTVLPAGQAVAPTPTPKVGPSASAEVARPTPVSGGDVTPATPTSSSPAPILVPLVLLLAVALVAFTTWRRRPRRPDQPEIVFRRVVWLASRLGYKPRPTQTVYEYAGMLARVVPTARDSLGIVATATVEVQYGKRQLSGAQLTVLSRAQRVVERALLKLFIRVPFFGRGGRKSNLA
jgi:transglutaminase-like putative cysteine protease